MARDPLDDLARLVDEGTDIAARADGTRAGGSTVRASDRTGAVTVVLDGDGRVAGVTVAADWRGELSAEGVGAAVQEAAQAAAVARLTAWAEVYAEQETSGVRGPRAALPLDRDGVADQLSQLATARMSSADGRVALQELLAMAEAIERGIDDVSARLESTIDARHTGHSPERGVEVTVTGGGEIIGVRYDRRWLSEAHEINIGRQTVAAFRAAYQQAAQRGVNRLIANSPLGDVQQAAQDPDGLARRLRLRD